MSELIFNPPPGWPVPPPGWKPPAGWTADPSWPPAPDGWKLWIPDPDATGGHGNDPADADATPSQPPVYTRDTGTGAISGSDPQARIAELERENAELMAQVASRSATDELVVLDDEQVLQQVGIYRYHHPLENATAFKERLDGLGARIAELVKAGGAIEASNMFTYDNSLAKGGRMVKDLGRLMLRAYNAEADNSIRSLRVGNVVTARSVWSHLGPRSPDSAG